jgi:hypothetical protein
MVKRVAHAVQIYTDYRISKNVGMRKERRTLWPLAGRTPSWTTALETSSTAVTGAGSPVRFWVAKGGGQKVRKERAAGMLTPIVLVFFSEVWEN